MQGRRDLLGVAGWSRKGVVRQVQAASSLQRQADGFCPGVSSRHVGTFILARETQNCKIDCIV